MTVRNVKKNLAAQQDLLPGVGPYQQVRRGVMVPVDGPAKSYIELWKDYCGDAYVGTFEDGFVAKPDCVAVSLALGKAYRYTATAVVIIPANSSVDANWVELSTSARVVQVMELYRRSYAEVGYNVVGTFQAGFTYVYANDVGIDEVTGKGYTGPAGDVAAGTNPASGGFVDRSGDLLSRRSTSYPSISAALSSGNYVIIEKDYNTATAILPDSHQTLLGWGGSITMDAVNAAVHAYKKDDVRLKDLKIFSDKVIPSGVAAYGIKLEEGEGHSLDGLNADGFTGAVFALKTVAATVRNVFYKNGIYHPSFQAGGYAVLLDKTNETVVDGVQFYADATHGRHALYVSRTDTSDGSYDGCLNTVANNIVARYVDRDDRNMWTTVIRKSKRTVVNNLVTDGANGGIAITPQNGNVDSFILNNINAKIYQYQNGLPVYGVSQLSVAAPSTYRSDCFIASNLILDIEAKDASITGDGCIGYSVSGTNGLISNVITNVATLGTPFLISGGVKNLIVSDVVDVVDDGVVGIPKPMFAFTGLEDSIEDITIRGIRTKRKMFDRIFAVKNMTVDYQRQLRVNLAAGAATITDPHELVDRVIVGAQALNIVFKSHVTQAAIDGLMARMAMDPGIDGFVVVRSTANKIADIRFFSQTGVQQFPQTAPNLSVTVTLFS